MAELTETTPCAGCSHPADNHRLDDSTNVSPVSPAAKFRCLGEPMNSGCSCPDFVRPAVEELAKLLYVLNEAETGAMTWDERRTVDGEQTAMVVHYRAVARVVLERFGEQR